MFDDDGYLKIVDRKKELIITAGGKNISPANIEAALKAFPLIGQVCVIGDNRPFVSALVVLDPEVAPAWAKQHGLEGKTLPELASDPVVIAEIDRNIASANQQFSNVERVKKFTLLGEEWLPDSEVLTPTMKLKRRGINQRFAAEIEAMYCVASTCQALSPGASASAIAAAPRCLNEFAGGARSPGRRCGPRSSRACSPSACRRRRCLHVRASRRRRRG